MRQTSIEGTETRTKRPAAELAIEAAEKAVRYRRKAVLATDWTLARLSLEINRALDRATSEKLSTVRDALLSARDALDSVLDGMAR